MSGCRGGYVGINDDHQGADRATCGSCGLAGVRFDRVTGRFARHAAPVNIASMTAPKIPPHGVRELREASKRAKSYIDTRNARIRYWHKEGHSLREIAEACGTITHSAVARIVKREPDE